MTYPFRGQYIFLFGLPQKPSIFDEIFSSWAWKKWPIDVFAMSEYSYTGEHDNIMTKNGGHRSCSYNILIVMQVLLIVQLHFSLLHNRYEILLERRSAPIKGYSLGKRFVVGGGRWN